MAAHESNGSDLLLMRAIIFQKHARWVPDNFCPSDGHVKHVAEGLKARGEGSTRRRLGGKTVERLFSASRSTPANEISDQMLKTKMHAVRQHRSPMPYGKLVDQMEGECGWLLVVGMCWLWLTESVFPAAVIDPSR